MPDAAPVVIRQATAADWEKVAEVQAESWRSAYRGIYPDAWLDGDVHEDRRRYWRDSLAGMDGATDIVFLAEEEGRAVGFACVRMHGHPDGPLLDNLHVRPDHKGRRIGRRLIGRAAAWVAERDAEAPLQLLVWVENRPARGFYASLGGREVELFDGTLPSGGTAPELRVRWERAADLAKAARYP